MLKAVGFAFLALVALPVAAACAATIYLLSGGVAVVQVETPEVDLTLPVPTRFMDLGLDVASFAVPLEERREMMAELPVEGWQPDFAALLRALDDYDDVVLVDVKSDSESVSIRKEQGRLRIDVESQNVRVRVSVPTGSLVRVAEDVRDFVFPAL